MFLEMAVSIGGSGGITRKKEEVFITIQMEICTKASSGMGLNMAKDITGMQLVIFTKETISSIWNMEKEEWGLLTEISMSVGGKEITSMAMGSTSSIKKTPSRVSLGQESFIHIKKWPNKHHKTQLEWAEVSYYLHNNHQIIVLIEKRRVLRK